MNPHGLARYPLWWAWSLTNWLRWRHRKDWSWARRLHGWADRLLWPREYPRG